jgi:hypothetical protein
LSTKTKKQEIHRIEVGNYYLKWNEETYGIQQNEISELKGFLKDAVPFFKASYEILNNLQKSNYKDKLFESLHGL